MYRADLSRTLALVVALPSAGATSSAFAREFRAADSRLEGCPDVEVLHLTGRPLNQRARYPLGICLDPKPEVAMTEVRDKIRRDPAHLIGSPRNLQ